MRETPGHAPLTVWSPHKEDAAPVLQVLAEGYDLDILGAPPAQSPKTGSLLLLYLAPAVAICRAMADGIAPTRALQTWQDQTRAILALNRRHRRGTRVLCITETLAHPAAFRDQFDLPEGPGPGGQLRNDQDDLFLLTLAQQMLHNDSQNRLLMAELEAVSISLSKAPPVDPVDPEAVFQAYQGNQETQNELRELTERDRNQSDELERLIARNSALEASERHQADALLEARQVIDLLQAQGRELQDELETLARRNIHLEETAAKLPELNRKLAQTCKTLQGRLTEKERSLSAADNLIRQAKAKQTVLQAEREQFKNTLASTKEELRRVYASRSYRLSGPLRRIRTLFSGHTPV